MSAKEKAEELVKKYRNPFNRKGCIPPTESMFPSTAKQCALIAVDELLEFENRVIEEWRNYFEGKGGSMKVERIFWEEVKHEIQKL
jgi:hypothetical protein